MINDNSDDDDEYDCRWPTVIEMLSCGKIDVKPLVTHRYRLEQTLEAFEMAKSGQGVKVMINCGQ